MPEVDLVDATWIAAPPAAVAAVVGNAANWAAWWPGMTLTVDRARGVLGVQWWVHRCREFARTEMAGSMEIWLEPAYEGVVLHYFLRLDPLGGPMRTGTALRAQRRHAVRNKRNFWAVKDQLEAGRR